jgi:hypothetical protein
LGRSRSGQGSSQSSSFSWILELGQVAVAVFRIPRFGAFLENDLDGLPFVFVHHVVHHGGGARPDPPPAGAALWRRSLPLASVIALGAPVWIVLNALFYDWPGGWCWGPRYLLPILPLAFIAIGLVVDQPRLRGPVRILCTAGFIVNLLGVVVSEDAYRRTTINVWLVVRTGYVTAGNATEPGKTVDIPRSVEDVLPPFSSIAGHWWLARVRLAGCDCSADSAECACTVGTFERNSVFLSPPWKDKFPDVAPSPPYGVSIIQPLWLRRLAH